MHTDIELSFRKLIIIVPSWSVLTSMIAFSPMLLPL